METKFKAMVGASNDKYSKLVDYVCAIKNGNDVDYDKLLKLVNSIHNDEIELIVNLCNLNQIIKELTSRTELSIPEFMK